MGFSRQEYWSGLPFLLPEDLPGPGIQTTFLTSPALTGGFFTTAPPGEHEFWGDTVQPITSFILSFTTFITPALSQTVVGSTQ